MLGPSFITYIDESGCDGFRFSAGSSEWMVLSAVTIRAVNDARLVSLLRDVRVDLGIKPRKPLHFSRLNARRKTSYLDRLIRECTPIRAISILVHKPSVEGRTIFPADKTKLYFYTAKLLIERVSWLARDHHRIRDGGDGTVRLVFSKRGELPYEALKGYLSKLFEERQHNTSICWKSLNAASFKVLPHGKRAGLQIADAVAHSFWRSVEHPREGRWAGMLAPLLYRHGRQSRAYGVKVFPPSAECLVPR
jgi:hypothetical protein